MKIIDLLNKIANGEEPPKKILFNDKVYKWNDGVDYENEDRGCVEFLLSQQCICKNFLNEEVEILETTITYKQDKIKKLYFHDLDDISDNEKILIVKINEIIDYINMEEK